MKEIQVTSSTDLYKFFVSIDRIIDTEQRPIIVFIPGLASSKEQWKEFISLIPQQFGVISIELRSHGKNSVSASPLSLFQMTNDLLDILNEVNATSVHIVGYSLGGYIGLNAAMIKPNLVKSLTMHATKFYWEESIFSTMNMLISPELLLEKNPKAVENMLQDHGDKWQEVLKAGQLILSEVYNNGLKTQDLMHVKCPVVVSVGANDEFIQIQDALELSKALPKGTLQVIPFAKHSLKTAPPQSFVSSILDTIQFCEKASKPKQD